MYYLEAPKQFNSAHVGVGNNRKLFLAGGIQKCPLWQKEMVEKLKDTDIIIFNPRRENFPINDPKAAEEQIKWEYYHLRFAGAVSFWFPKETLCPIVLFELGCHSERAIPIFVGVHPEYKRRQDVEIQMNLRKPGLEIAYSLDELVAQIKPFEF